MERDLLVIISGLIILLFFTGIVGVFVVKNVFLTGMIIFLIIFVFSILIVYNFFTKVVVDKSVTKMDYAEQKVMDWWKNQYNDPITPYGVGKKLHYSGEVFFGFLLERKISKRFVRVVVSSNPFDVVLKDTDIEKDNKIIQTRNPFLGFSSYEHGSVVKNPTEMPYERYKYGYNTTPATNIEFYGSNPNEKEKPIIEDVPKKKSRWGK